MEETKPNETEQTKHNIYSAFCFKCKQKQKIKEPYIEKRETRKGIKNFIRGNCIVCGGKVCQTIKI